jgi:tRNA(Ile)-lysidine synthase
VHGFIQKIQQKVRDQQLIDPGGRIAAAVSGGADSVSMACALDALGFDLHIAYVDHGVNPNSAEWGQWVLRFASQLGRPFHLLACDAGRGSEAEMRDGRYAALESLEVEMIATAHTADDQAETVLMRLIRGAGSVGLAGIPPRRGRFVRPLLGVTRAEVTAFLKDCGQNFIHDPSNDTMDPMRNRVRHQLLPLLKSDFQPQMVRNLTRLANTLRSERGYLEQSACAYLEAEGLALSALRSLHPGLLPHVIRAACPVVISAERLDAIERLIDGVGGAVQLEGGVTVDCLRKEDCLTFRPTGDRK